MDPGPDPAVERDGWRPDVGVWTAEQTRTFLACVRHHRLYALFHLVALRGLRRGEAAGLAWTDLDLDAGTLAVSSQLQQLGGRMVTAPPKSDAGRRVVALDATTIAALREHQLRQQAEREAAATLALAAGADLKVVQDQLGHSTIVLTADTYTSVLPETANTAAELTAALLFPARSRSAKGVKPAVRRARRPPLPAWARPDHRKQARGRAR